MFNNGRYLLPNIHNPQTNSFTGQKMHWSRFLETTSAKMNIFSMKEVQREIQRNPERNESF